MRFLLALSVAFMAVAGAALAVPTPIVETGFETPSGNIDCNAGRNDGTKLVACTVFTTSSRKGLKVWSMRPTGRVYFGYVMGNPATGYPKLAYGRTWTWHGFRCRSERSGLTCTNRSGHGFVLSRQSQRIF